MSEVRARSSLRACVLMAVVLTIGCGGSQSEQSAPAPQEEWFVDRTKETGLDFVHFNGMSGEIYYPEVMPPGVALFDYDNDGDLDAFITQGQMLGPKPIEKALMPPRGDLRGRLFRNDLTVSATGAASAKASARQGPVLRFTDVTASSGIESRAYAIGTATGDYDDDGCVDLYVTAVGNNQLFRNNCDGTFTDVTAASGTTDRGFTVPAAFVDIDRDGRLDLYVGHYLQYSLESDIDCKNSAGLPDYCPPKVYTPEASRLFWNRGNGRFVDRTPSLQSPAWGPALGIATADYNGDGWIDIYVANDGTANTLWINQRDGTFIDTAMAAGAALSPEGLAKASMGVDAGDFDNDGDEDIFIGELTGQGADLYVNDGRASFADGSPQAGLRLPTLPFTGFGAAWLDFDNDGLLDIAMVNGAVEQPGPRTEPLPLRQPRQLFRQVAGRRFEDVSQRAGRTFAGNDVGRGAAFGDLDNDGDTDIIAGNDAGPAHVLINEIGARKHWVGLRLMTGKRDALGARVSITRGDGIVLWRRARADGSYASSNDPRVLAGLGDTTDPPKVRVYWPDGREESFAAVPIDRYTTLVQGTGKP